MLVVVDNEPKKPKEVELQFLFLARSLRLAPTRDVARSRSSDKFLSLAPAGEICSSLPLSLVLAYRSNVVE